MADIISKLGTDEATVSHIRWLLKQDKETVDNLFQEVKETTLGEALSEMSGHDSWEQPPSVISTFLGEYCENTPVDLSEDLSVKISQIQVDPYNSSSRSSYYFSYIADIVVDGHVVRRVCMERVAHGSSREQDRYDNRQISETLATQAVENLRKSHSSYSISKDSSKTIASIHEARAEIELLHRVYAAWGHALRQVSDVEHFIHGLLEGANELYFDTLRNLIQVYRDKVQYPHCLVSREDYVCTYGSNSGSKAKWHIFVEDSKGSYRKIHKNNPRYSGILSWATEQWEL